MDINEPDKKFTIEWLRSFPKLANLSDEQAANVIKTLSLFTFLTYELFQKTHS